MSSSRSLERVPRRSGFDARRVLIILLLLALATLLSFALGYFRLVHYEARVARHIPGDAAMVVRVDVKQVVLFEPVRRHVFPALDGVSGDIARRAKFERQADVNLAMDLREVAVAFFDDGDWLVLIGGLFPSQGVVEALARVLGEDESFDCQLERKALHCSEVVFEQAADGVIALGSSAPRVQQALQAGSHHPWLSDQPVSAGWSAAWADRELFRTGDVGLEGARAAADLTSSELEVTVHPRPASAPTAALERWLAEARGAAQHLATNFAGERAVLARARVTERTGRPVIESHWTRDELDLAAANLGSWLKRRLASPQPSSAASSTKP